MRHALVVLMLLPTAGFSFADATTADAGFLPVGVRYPDALWSGSRVLVFGGMLTNPVVRSVDPQPVVFEYDPRAGGPAVPHPIPFPVSAHTAEFFDPRDRPDSGCAGGCAYFAGGFDAVTWETTDRILRWNDGNALVLESRLPEPTFGMTAAWTGTEAFLFGGTRPDLTSISTRILRLDPLRDELTVVATELPVATYHASAAWDPRSTPACPSGCAYVFGGLSAGGPQADHALDVIQRFSPATGEATLLAQRLPGARYWAPASGEGARIAIFGGSDGGGPRDDIVRFDALADVPAWTSDVVLPSPRHGAGAAWSGDATFVVGGCCYFPIRLDPEDPSASTPPPHAIVRLEMR